jgi:short-subunit dehydrogenase
MGTVHIVIIPSMTGLKTGNNLTVYTATVVFFVLQADAIDQQ